MQHIHRIPNLVSKEFCTDIINIFENSNLKQKGESYVKKDGLIQKTANNTKISTDICIFPTFVKKAKDAGEPIWEEVVEYVNSKLDLALDEYKDIHPILDKIQKFALEGYNIQRYLPGEGFYNWHCENSGYKLGGDRVLAWMIYLNDVEDGGTEFKLQNHTEKAEAGKFLIWPAGWTHIHRGQISETTTKYIITGWYRHIED